MMVTLRHLRMDIPYVQPVKHFRDWWGEAGGVAQPLRTLVVLAEDLASVPGIHMVAHNCPSRGSDTLF